MSGRFQYLRCLAGHVSMLALISLSSAAPSQEHNFGYYQKLFDHGQQTTWVLLTSAYYPEVAEIEPEPNQWLTPWPTEGSGDCSSEPLPGNELCRGARSKEADTDPVELPPVVVTGSPISRPSYMLAFLPWRGSDAGPCGSSGDSRCGGTVPVGIGIVEFDEIGLCDSQDWQQIQDEIVRRAFQTPAVMEELRELVRVSRDTSTEQFGRLVVTTRPSGALAVRFQHGSEFATVIEARCDSLQVSMPSDVPGISSSIIVHTHPRCDRPVEPGPSPADRDLLGGAHGFRSGLILDLDNELIIHYEPDDAVDDPGDQEALCGIERFVTG